MHIQKEFGITKAEMGYAFSAFARLYTLRQIRAAGRPYWVPADLFYRYLRLVKVATLLQGFATGLLSLIGLRAITRDFRGTSLSGK